MRRLGGWLASKLGNRRKPERRFEELITAGNQSLEAARLPEAESLYRAAVDLDSTRPVAHLNLGYARFAQGRHAEASVALQRAIDLQPANAEALYLLGASLLALHRAADALVPLQAAVSVNSSLSEAWRDLGRALFECGRTGEARELLESRAEVEPESPELQLFLGNVLAHARRLTDAVTAYDRALRLSPRLVAAHINKAPALVSLGDVDGALRSARAALALEPASEPARSNLLLALSADARCSAPSYLAEARAYGALVSQRVATCRLPTRQRTSSRLNVGFVSGDLRSHPVGYFLEPLIEHWDRGTMKTFAYNNHASFDALTERLRRSFSAWRNVWSVDDEGMAALVRSDEIDVLIDLSGHTPGHRLPVFARKPARVQATWLGYWASTGLTEIDFVLADTVSLPRSHHSDFCERVVELPDTRLCFKPPMVSSELAVAALPALRNGYVTFGSFQRVAKVNDDVMATWARVVTASHESRLRWQSADFADVKTRQASSDRLVAAGVPTSRLQLLPGVSRAAYLESHDDVDLLLDTFPHSGATTTCEALWMGVPTVTLQGSRLLERQGASLLNAAGLADWIAADRTDFVDIACRSARDLDSLARLRAGLRQQVSDSPLMDGRRFAGHFQQTIGRLAA